MPEALPAGYARQLVGDIELVAHDGVRAALDDALRHASTLYDWAADQPQPHALRGRAPVYVATLATGDTVAVRHAWHGGLLAPITGDRWMRPGRAGTELRKSIALCNGGIPTAPVLAYALYPAGPGFVRVDVVTRFMENTFDLAAVLSKLAPGVAIDAAQEATRVLLRKLAVQRLVHPDLNAKNILIQKRVQQAPVAMVIDVDTMRHRPGADLLEVAGANSSRLLRSLKKHARQAEWDIELVNGLAGSVAATPGEADPALPPITGFGTR